MTAHEAVEGAQLVTGLIAARARGDTDAVRVLAEALQAVRSGDGVTSRTDPALAVAEIAVTLLARVRDEPVDRCATALGLAIEQGVTGRPPCDMG